MSATTATVVQEDLAGRLEARLAEVGFDRPRIVALRRLSGGASRETWSFDAVDAAGHRSPLVLRRDPADEHRPDNMAREAEALTAAGQHGVPVPRLRDHGLDPAALGAPYLLMDRVEGESIARRILRDDAFAHARSVLTADLGRAAAAVHAVPVDAMVEVRAADGLELLWERYLETGVPRPVLDVAFRWLEERRPEPVPPRLVHGDFRLGNVLVDENGLASVLDWELVHVGDPMEDLGYLSIRAWRFGGPLPVAGVGTFDDLFEAYAAASGHRPDPDRVRWWQVVGTLSWGVSAAMQAQRHFSGATRSVELAAIGRRVVEQEHDLLQMMDEGAAR